MESRPTGRGRLADRQLISASYLTSKGILLSGTLLSPRPSHKKSGHPASTWMAWQVFDL